MSIGCGCLSGVLSGACAWKALLTLLCVFACAEVRSLDEDSFDWLGWNVSVELIDRTPCHSTYQFLSSGRGNREILGPRKTHFATTHHLGSISYKKGGTPCARKLEQTVGSALRGKLEANEHDSFRGLYWYPPGGFTEWHTDGSQVKGWRVYTALLTQENASSFVYMDATNHSVHVVQDRHFQANLFRVNGDTARPLWHAVISQQAHRFSVGIAISDALARQIIDAAIR